MAELNLNSEPRLEVRNPGMAFPISRMKVILLLLEMPPIPGWNLEDDLARAPRLIETLLDSYHGGAFCEAFVVDWR